MTNRAFNIPRSKDPSKVNKILDAIDIAAKYFVYKLYDAARRDRPVAFNLGHKEQEKARASAAVAKIPPLVLANSALVSLANLSITPTWF
jgi:hypothetical protein